MAVKVSSEQDFMKEAQAVSCQIGKVAPLTLLSEKMRVRS